jgi:hypothetical protein
MIDPLLTSIDPSPCTSFAEILDMNGGHDQARTCIHRPGIWQLTFSALMTDCFACLLADESECASGCMMDKHPDQQTSSKGGLMIAHALMASRSLVVDHVSFYKDKHNQ